jgi:hypothetical protein
MEWKIVLKHRENPWVIEIIGIGENPHRPSEVVVRSNTKLPYVKKVLNEIRFTIEHPPPFLHSDMMQSRDDMYLWRFAAGKFTGTNPDWVVEDNLPELEIKEDEEVKKLRDEGIVPIY